MKLHTRLRFPGTWLATGLLGCLPLGAQVTLDGTRSPGEGYSELSVQQTRTNWGTGNFLGNLHAVQEGNLLHLHIGGRANGNAILLFIDAREGGQSFIPTGLITSGGEENSINNLGSSPTSGLTFENGFTPELAIRIWGSGSESHVNRYQFASGTRTYSGRADNNTISDGPISGLRVNWADAATLPDTNPAQYDHAGANQGAEIALNLAALGVPTGSQQIKVMAMLVNGSSDYASNQVLGSRISSTSDIGGGRNSINFETEPGIQTLTIPVVGVDLPPDGDEDGDGFTNAQESAGTSPLGYISDPLIPNYTNMSVAGDFTDPPWEATQAGTVMTQGDTASLVSQYQWTLDRYFATPGQALNYKFTTGGSFAINWGRGIPTGSAARNGDNISALVGPSGIHRIFFDQGGLTQTFGRRSFDSLTEFLTAYGLTDPDGDADGDGLTNEEEFLENLDPLSADTDGDGLNDLIDPKPLTQSRDITFRVNMNVVATNSQNFVIGQNPVKLMVFNGPKASFQEILGGYEMEETDTAGIYEVTVEDCEGFAGAPFGDYKFVYEYNVLDENDEIIEIRTQYEQLSANPFENRTLSLGAPNSPQIVPTVFFSNDAGPVEPTDGYSLWVASLTWPEGADTSRNGNPDADAFTNEQEFLFGTSPVQADGSLVSTSRESGNVLVLRWNQRSSGATYGLLQSTTLAEPWDPASVPGLLLGDDPDQSGVPAGYLRRKAEIPLTQGGSAFFRVSGTETP